MSDAIEMNISGIQCDNCDFADESVKVEDYAQWVNKPCPKCGANLLTEADFQNVQLLLQLTQNANYMLPRDEENTDEEKIVMTFKMDGSGKINVEIKPVDED